MERSARSRPRTATAVTVRPMKESDVPELLRRGFGERAEFGAYVADAGIGSLAGMAVHYEIPFMHTLQPLLMLKWLYVDPEFRGERVGQRLMRQMARHARAVGHERISWFVLNDNEPAQAFYRGLGAVEDPEWRRWIMPVEALNRLAEGGDV